MDISRDTAWQLIGDDQWGISMAITLGLGLA